MQSQGKFVCSDMCWSLGLNAIRSVAFRTRSCFLGTAGKTVLPVSWHRATNAWTKCTAPLCSSVPQKKDRHFTVTSDTPAGQFCSAHSRATVHSYGHPRSAAVSHHVHLAQAGIKRLQSSWVRPSAAPLWCKLPVPTLRSFSGAVQTEEEPTGDSFEPDVMFHEELTFDSDGFAVSHPIRSAAANSTKGSSRPEMQHESLAGSLSGMLCVLQLLPYETSNWIAHYVGFHSMKAMLELRRDLEAGLFETANIEQYCVTGSAAATQLGGTMSQDRGASAQLQEILLDDGLPSLLRLSDGTEVELPQTLPSVYVLSNLRQLNELLRFQPNAVGRDGVLMSVEDGGAQRLTAGDELLQRPENHADELKQFRSLFSPQRRMGISRTLHRVACIEGQNGAISGLTFRIGRHIPAAAWPLMDVLGMIDREHRKGKYNKEKFGLHSSSADAQAALPCSVLVLGGPGTGKTTILRDVAQQLSVRFGLGRRVVIVDSSSEIGGQGQVPHPAVGSARRFVVPQGVYQSNVLIQALTNHNPDVIIVDELSGHADIDAARSICHRGINLVATAHSTSLQNLLSNPQMNPVMGGLHEVILGAQEVREFEKRRGSGASSEGRKPFSRSTGARTRTERRQPPCFQVIVEIVAPNAWRIHWRAAESIDAVLAGEKPPSELRVLHNGRLYSRDESFHHAGVKQDHVVRRLLRDHINNRHQKGRIQVGQICINTLYTYTHRKVRLPDNMYEYWDRWQQETREFEAEQKAATEQAQKQQEERKKKVEELGYDSEDETWAKFFDDPIPDYTAPKRSEYQKFIMGEGTHQQECRLRLERRCKAREKAKAAAKGTMEGKRRGTKGASSTKASTSKGDEDVGVNYGWDIAAWIYDELVDMNSFWTHLMLAVSETVCGSAVMFFFQINLGGPLLRGFELALMVSTFLYSSWYSSSLPMMWDRPTPGLLGTGFWRNVDEVHTQPYLQPYFWMMPFLAVGGMTDCPEPFRSNFHLYILIFQLVVVWCSSVLYPMDWDMWFQEWPLPTVYSGLIAHVLTQFSIVVENSFPRAMMRNAPEEMKEQDVIRA